MPKRKDFLRNEKILNTRGDQAFYMGAENAKIESAEKSAETGGHPQPYKKKKNGNGLLPATHPYYCRLLTLLPDLSYLALFPVLPSILPSLHLLCKGRGFENLLYTFKKNDSNIH